MADNPFFPDFDMEDFMSKFSIPGADNDIVKSLIETNQKNLDAIVAANQAAAEGYQVLAQRQMTIFQDSLNNLANLNTVAENPAESAAETIQSGMEQMQELLELAAKANKDAFEIISARAQETINDLGK